MTKQEAIQAMKEGKKVTHRYFSPDEWITLKDGKIVTEEGYTCEPRDFWGWRDEEVWGDDWELFEKNLPSTNK